MCLKFLLEGNAENQALIGCLEAREVVGGQDVMKEMGVDVAIEEGKVKVLKNQREGVRGMRRASESSASVRERFARLDVNGHGVGSGNRTGSEKQGKEQASGKVMDEETSDEPEFM